MFFNLKTFEIYKPVDRESPSPEDPFQEDREVFSERVYVLDGEITGTRAPITIREGLHNMQQFQNAKYILRCAPAFSGLVKTGYYLKDENDVFYEVLGDLTFNNVLPSYKVYLKDPQVDIASMIVVEAS